MSVTLQFWRSSASARATMPALSILFKASFTWVTEQVASPSASAKPMHPASPMSLSVRSRWVTGQESFARAWARAFAPGSLMVLWLRFRSVTLQASDARASANFAAPSSRILLRLRSNLVNRVVFFEITSAMLPAPLSSILFRQRSSSATLQVVAVLETKICRSCSRMKIFAYMDTQPGGASPKTSTNFLFLYSSTFPHLRERVISSSSGANLFFSMRPPCAWESPAGDIRTPKP
mmetsp:Transcript_18755/g.38276  ORF Transcript_18755/g.38276 Transcript_18755/m.38276 type:complete len:235 (-) Transcript_18755:395-1099(-)